MPLINAKYHSSTCFLLTAILYLTTAVSHAEWIQAKPQGAKHVIWINTESNVMFVGDNCTALMQLKHLSGTKPRPFRQRQEAHLQQLRNHSKDSQQAELDGIQATQQWYADSNKGDSGAVSIPLDPLQLTYRSQPKNDPLNRNQFNISIDNHAISLNNQHGDIEATITGRYEHRPGCGR